MFPALAPRSFPSLFSMADEIARSRMYAGLHFDYSNNDGATAGRELAHYTFATCNEPEGNDRARRGTRGGERGALATGTEATFEARKDFAYGKTTALALPNGGSVTVTISNDGGVAPFASDTTVFCVMVKDSTEANMYRYVPYDGTRTDEGLSAPLNRGGNAPQLGYIQLCRATAD